MYPIVYFKDEIDILVKRVESEDFSNDILNMCVEIGVKVNEISGIHVFERIGHPGNSILIQTSSNYKEEDLYNKYVNPKTKVLFSRYFHHPKWSLSAIEAFYNQPKTIDGLHNGMIFVSDELCRRKKLSVKAKTARGINIYDQHYTDTADVIIPVSDIYGCTDKSAILEKSYLLEQNISELDTDGNLLVFDYSPLLCRVSELVEIEDNKDELWYTFFYYLLEPDWVDRVVFLSHKNMINQKLIDLIKARRIKQYFQPA